MLIDKSGVGHAAADIPPSQFLAVTLSGGILVAPIDTTQQPTATSAAGHTVAIH